jgi:hypothetical protein
MGPATLTEVVGLAKVVFITGLVASGKTTQANQMRQERHYEYIAEGFWADDQRQKNIAWLINHLQHGRDCLVTEGAFMFPVNRGIIQDVINQHVPGAEIEWTFFENNEKKAEINIRKDPGRDIAGALKQNRLNSPRYKIPPGAKVLEIVTD